MRCPACGNPIDVGCRPHCPDFLPVTDEHLEQAPEFWEVPS